MHVVILGANSDIARAVAAEFARHGATEFTLASRDVAEIERSARDLSVRFGARARALHFDALDYASHAAFAAALAPKPDVVLVAFGLIGDQLEAQADWNAREALLATNLLGAASILEPLAANMEARGTGCIIGISSVAGERGRASNYVYGAAKAGLTVYLSGLRNRLWRHRVRVMTVLPGFVRTKMTAHLALPAALTATPEEVAAAIHRGWRRGAHVVNVKPVWRWIMLLIRALPESLFIRTRL